MEWLFFTAIILICIGFPIILLLYIWYLPLVVIVLFFVWIIASIVSIVISKSHKWYEELIVTFVLTGLFTIVLAYAVSNSKNYLFDEDNAGIIIAPAISIVAIYFLGSFLKEKHSKNMLARQAKQKEEIWNEISLLEKEVDKLREQVDEKDKVLHLVKLLSFCGADLDYLKVYLENEKAFLLIEKTKEKKEVIRKLKAKL